MQAASSTAEYEALSSLLQQAWTQAPHALVMPRIHKHAFGYHGFASGAAPSLLLSVYRY